uniref:Reverse transcriptase domain-containing protein n=1 Tax=Xenopus tropicalis TaxID=8364 RepID=A0A803JT65_XENTR
MQHLQKSKMTTLKITSLNVRSLKSPCRRAALFAFLETLNFDICLLQECAIDSSMDYAHLKKDWKLGPSFWSGSNDAKPTGVGILCRGPYFSIQTVTEIVPGRALCVHLFFKGLFARIVNIYASPDKQERTDLFELLPLFCVGSSPLLVGGDFNCVYAGESRQGGDPNRKDKTSYLLKNVIDDFKLKDAWKLCSNDPGFTWSKKNIQSRIDFIFLSDSSNPFKCEILDNVISDDKVLISQVTMSKEKRVNKGLWRLNTQLLDNPQISDKFVRTYQCWQNKRKPHESMLHWWEGTKPKIRDFFIKAGKEVARGKKRFFYLLNLRLQTLFKLRDADVNVDDDILLLKAEIAKTLEQKGKEIIFNSHVQHLEEGEKCSRFFFKKVMDKKELILSLEGMTSMSDILNTAYNFYHLFNEKQVDASLLKDCINVLNAKLSFLDQEILSKDISLEELFITFKSFSFAKAPGEDSLPVEFYLRFWEILKDDLFLVFKESFLSDTLPPSWRRGIVSLIFKKGDKERLENYRPITLLNVDYKVMAKLISLRLKPFLSNLIHPDQVCGVPGRSMTESLNVIRDVIWFCNERNLNLAVLSLDFEKAFDRVSHDFLFKVLTKMALPNFILNGIKVLYRSSFSQISVNGFLTQKVFLKSGVKQGCPLSPMLFICAIEPLLIYLRNDKVIRGIHVPGGGGHQVKVSGYMDDITIFCSTSYSLKRALTQTSFFCGASGFKLNVQKCNCLGFGSWDPSLTPEITIQQEQIKILGLVFNTDITGVVNWDSVLAKMEKKILIWNLRNLTMEGKILIIKMVLLPLMLHVGMVFPPSSLYIKKLTRVCFKFLWGSKMEKLKRDFMYRDKMCKGKDVPNLLLFFYVKYFCFCFNIFNSKGIFSCFLRYAAGMLFKHWFRPPLNCPMLLSPPKHYVIIERAIRLFSLKNVDVGVLGNQKKTTLILRQEEVILTVSNFSEQKSKKVWRNVFGKYLANVHKDLAWAIVHQCLPTREFQHRRGLVARAKCPRQNCCNDETVMHLFWNCQYAQQLWKTVGPLFKHIGNLQSFNYEMVFYGLFICPNFKQFYVCWMIINCFKNALWKTRNILLFNRDFIDVKQCIKMAFSEMYVYFLRDKKCQGNDEAVMLWKPSLWNSILP